MGGRKKRFYLSANKMTMVTVAVGYCILAAFGLREPTLAKGAAIGMGNLLLIEGVLLFSVLLVALTFNVAINSERWQIKTFLTYFLVTVGASAFLNDKLLVMVDDRWPFAESVMQNKIKYFCTENINVPVCVDQINVCPQCAARMDAQSRKQVRALLAQFDQKLAEIQKGRAIASTKGPITELTEKYRKEKAN